MRLARHTFNFSYWLLKRGYTYYLHTLHGMLIEHYKILKKGNWGGGRKSNTSKNPTHLL